MTVQPVRALAIGASAGGIEALMQLLPGLPASLQVPVFVVIHLPPGKPSLLVNIFSARCAVEHPHRGILPYSRFGAGGIRFGN